MTVFASLVSKKTGDDSVADYELTYQDKDGDWLLAGDVPWRYVILVITYLLF